MIDFIIEIPKEKIPVILQLSDPQMLDASQATEGRLAKGEQSYWAKDKKEERCFGYIREIVESTKPDLILIPGYQRGERTDIIKAQAKLTAFRCNAYIARSSYSMNDDEKGGNSMIVAPDGQILNNMGKEIDSITEEVDIKWKHTRPAGFGCGIVRNDDFINDGLRPQIFNK